jgi:hypothetical protein
MSSHGGGSVQRQLLRSSFQSLRILRSVIALSPSLPHGLGTAFRLL